MRSVKEWEHYQDSMTDEDDAFKWVYTCVKCLAKELDCSEQDAKQMVNVAQYSDE